MFKSIIPIFNIWFRTPHAVVFGIWLKKRKKSLILTGFFLLLFSLFIPQVWISQFSSSKLYRGEKYFQGSGVGIIFGALVYPNGQISPILADRVSAGVALYKAGKVQKLLMTGDNGSRNYDEVTVMKKHAMELGVPENDITLDYAGFSTYDSCYRASRIFGVKKAVLVTQNFHIERAVFLCEKLGTESFGYGVSDWEKYPDQKFYLSVREFFARIKAFFNVYVFRPEPKFLGDFEGIE